MTHVSISHTHVGLSEFPQHRIALNHTVIRSLAVDGLLLPFSLQQKPVDCRALYTLPLSLVKSFVIYRLAA